MSEEALVTLLGLEETARLLHPSPCETSPAPALSFATVDLGLELEDWRRGGAELERSRAERQGSNP
ncbi:MAG: hypothetical protein HQL39_02180 [Alphaproteobacteria bacterium]|nr:hypothetical protein [Alphaproteobacteria bacterium]MBF0372207.1 hypothetical protein [Alphaproteobacteria bacterium]